MYYTLKQAYEKLKAVGYLYKDKTLTRRTVKTMAENELFKTLKFCECGKTYIVEQEEIDQKCKEV